MKLLPSWFTGAGTNDAVFIKKNGKLIKSGIGLTTLVSSKAKINIIPGSLQKKSFQFVLFSNDGQEFIVAGDISYKIKTDDTVLSTFDFGVDLAGRPTGNGMILLGEQVMQSIKPTLIAYTSQHDIQALVKTRDSLELLFNTNLLENFAFNITSVSIHSANAEQKLANAFRSIIVENLLKLSDKALSDRQAADADSKNQLAESAIDNSITLEEKRKTLIEKKLANNKLEQTANQENLKMTLGQYTDMSAAKLLSYALLHNANVGTINITSDILAALQKDV
jgi:hypothetical protein